MKRVLLTGMSGVGKSTLVQELAARGYRAIDTDYDGWSHWIDTRTGLPAEPPGPGEFAWNELDWVWHEERVRDLLSDESDESGDGPGSGRASWRVLFVAGTAPNQGKFHARFDHIILLSAPLPVIVRRLANRTNNPYGTTPRSLARVREHVETVEPLLRRAAGHEIDTSAPLERVVEQVLRLASVWASGGR